MNRISNRIVLFGLVIAVFFLAFLWQYINYYQFFGILFIPWLFSVKGRIRVRWILYFVAILFSAIVGVSPVESLKWFYMFVLITLYSAAVKKTQGYRHLVLDAFFYCSIFHCFFILLQYFNPTLAIIFIKALVPPEVAETSSIGAYLTSGVCTGVAGEAAFAMLYSSYVFFYGFIKYVSGKKKKYTPFILLGLVCVLLNGKRIAIVINVVTAFVSYYLLIKSSKRQTGNVLTIGIVLAIIIGIIAYTDLGSIIIEKNSELAESGDITNGRADLNAHMLKIFEGNPIFGIGPFCTSMYVGEFLGHNIYMTTLSENGLIGFICLCMLLLLNIRDSFKRFKCGDHSVYMYVSIYIQIFFIVYGFTGNPLYGSQFLITYIIFSINENRNTYLS